MEELNPLEGRARWLFHVQALARFLLVWIPGLAIGGGVLAAVWSPLYAGVAAVTVLFGSFLVAVWYPSIAFDRWGWAVRDRDLLIASGVLFYRITTIPLGRIQHVDVRQGPLEQALGLSRVHVHTASGMGADGVIPGLEPAAAEALRDRLVESARGGGGV